MTPTCLECGIDFKPYTHEIICNECGGDGFKEVKQCHKCKGAGEITINETQFCCSDCREEHLQDINQH